MPKVLFTQDAELKQGDGKGPKFEKGKVYDLTADQAERWIRRGVATDDPKAIAAASPEPKVYAKPAEPALDLSGSGAKVVSTSQSAPAEGDAKPANKPHHSSSRHQR
jgi:hypothetical protein